MEWRVKPARDLGLTREERLRSQHREPGLGSVLLQWCWRLVVRTYLRVFHRLSVTGREQLPKTPPFVMVANHTSHLDALTLASVLPGNTAGRAFALAAGEMFFGSRAASAFAAFAINALPVWRKHPSRNEVSALRQRLMEDGLVYILFPEGTRSRDGTLASFRPGIGALVAGTKIPVVPCFLGGAWAAWPAQRRLPRPGPLHLVIGSPLGFAEVVNGRSGWACVARACEDAVRGLGAGEPSREA